MARYINADTLIKAIPDTRVDMFENCRNCSTLLRDEVIEIIDAQPTVDVLEVIRCKDCKYASSYCIEGTIFCVDSECPNLEDGFCNRAERRGGE